MPSEDFSGKVDALCAETFSSPPPDTWDVTWFKARYSLTYMVATRRIEKLLALGKIQEAGRFGSRNMMFYRAL